jgi:hypothetical protein
MLKQSFLFHLGSVLTAVAAGTTARGSFSISSTQISVRHESLLGCCLVGIAAAGLRANDATCNWFLVSAPSLPIALTVTAVDPISIGMSIADTALTVRRIRRETITDETSALTGMLPPSPPMPALAWLSSGQLIGRRILRTRIAA